MEKRFTGSPRPTSADFVGRTYSLEYRGVIFSVEITAKMVGGLNYFLPRATLERHMEEIGYAEILRSAVPVVWRSETESLPSLEEVLATREVAKRALVAFEATLASRLPQTELVEKTSYMSWGKDGDELLPIGTFTERADGRKGEEVATAEELTELMVLRSRAYLEHPMSLLRDIHKGRSMERAVVGVRCGLSVRDGWLPHGDKYRGLVIEMGDPLNPPARLEEGVWLKKATALELLDKVAKFAAGRKAWVLRDLGK